MSQIEQSRKEFSQTSESILDQFIEETVDSGSQYLKIQDGQSVKLDYTGPRFPMRRVTVREKMPEFYKILEEKGAVY